MRFVIILPGSLLLLAGVVLIGITRPTSTPETVFPAPRTATEFLRRGKLYQQQGDVEKALADYVQAAKLEPENSTAYLYQASALSSLNRPAEAIQQYQLVKQLEQQKGQSFALTDYLIQEQQKKLR